MAKEPTGETNRYKALIETIFFSHWEKGETEFEFERKEIKETAEQLQIELPGTIYLA